MAVKADSETIREMARNLQSTINTLNNISAAIRQGCSALTGGGWEDTKQAEFTGVMLQAASLTEEPIDTLEAAIPKLESLAGALDEYMGVSF